MAKRRFRSRGKFRRIFRRKRRVRTRRLTKFIKRTLRRMSEIKYSLLNQNTFVNVDAFTGAVVRLNPAISQGVDKDERIGNKIRYKFLQFRMMFRSLDGTNAINPPQMTYRIMIVQMRILPSAGLVLGPAAGEIFDNSTSAFTTVYSSIKNLNVRVLMDRIYVTTVGQATAGTTYPYNTSSYHYIKKKIRVNNNVTYASSTDNLPTDPKDNYYLVIASDAGALNDAILAVAYSMRISYIDI